jgi:hypothetical protein
LGDLRHKKSKKADKAFKNRIKKYLQSKTVETSNPEQKIFIRPG